MVKIGKCLVAALVVSFLMVGIPGCKDQGTPAGDTGDKIDQIVEKAGQKINTKVGEAGDKIEKAGQKLKDSVKAPEK
ncbi:MAG TPA: Rv0909 family putative TA system antitoxin [Spirochaetota bacterium]|nr:Rv0909 family putative TA system antitoxin [Spirochaetota bacterium]